MLILIIGSLVLTGCNSRKTITDTPEYQKTQQIATSGMNYVSEKTADFIKENEQVQGAITATQEGVKQLKGQSAQRRRKNFRQGFRKPENRPSF